jgi:hypothetical protein
MVWISKKEIAYYIILREEFRDRVFNLGEAIDLLQLFGSRNAARKVIKNLVKKGFIKEIDSLNYKMGDLEGAFKKLLYEYIRQRFYRALKSRGYGITVDREGNKRLIVMCEEDAEPWLQLLASLKEFGINVVKCKKELH